MARPSKFTAENREAIINYVRKGVSYSMAARATKVGKRTLYDWLKLSEDEAKPEYVQFRVDLEAARAQAEIDVLLAQRKSALEPQYTKDKSVRRYQDGSVITEVKEGEKPPSTTAQKYISEKKYDDVEIEDKDSLPAPIIQVNFDPEPTEAELAERERRADLGLSIVPSEDEKRQYRYHIYAFIIQSTDHADTIDEDELKRILDREGFHEHKTNVYCKFMKGENESDQYLSELESGILKGAPVRFFKEYPDQEKVELERRLLASEDKQPDDNNLDVAGN